MEWFQCLTDACLEPRQIANVGLFLDIIGAGLVAVTALWRLKTPSMSGVDFGGIIHVPATDEDPRQLRVRRRLVAAGGVLLAIGFAFQIYANHLQMTAC